MTYWLGIGKKIRKETELKFYKNYITMSAISTVASLGNLLKIVTASAICSEEILNFEMILELWSQGSG